MNPDAIKKGECCEECVAFYGVRQITGSDTKVQYCSDLGCPCHQVLQDKNTQGIGIGPKPPYQETGVADL